MTTGRPDRLRHRTILPIVLIGLAVSWVSASATAQDDRPVFRSSADAVVLNVSVRRRGRPVTGLKPEQFRILDNGVPQILADFSYEQLPIDVTIVLDVSQSVTGERMEQLRRAMQALRSDLEPPDRLRLMTFNMRVQRLVDLDGSGGETDAALAAVQPTGSSAVLDALAVALATPVPPDRRQLVVLFSDGADSTSVVEPNGLIDIARRTTPTVAVALTSIAGPLSVLNGRFARQVMLPGTGFYATLARETGGAFVMVAARQNLTASFRDILRDFRSSYVLHFVPAGVERGGTHTVDVQVDRDDVEVRTRREYTWD